MIDATVDMARIMDKAVCVGGMDKHPLYESINLVKVSHVNIFQRYVLFSNGYYGKEFDGTPVDVQNSLHRLFRTSALINMCFYIDPVSGIQRFVGPATGQRTTYLFIDRAKLNHSEIVVLDALINAVIAKSCNQNKAAEQLNTELESAKLDVSRLKSDVVLHKVRADQEKNRADKMCAYIERIYTASQQTGAQNIDVLKQLIESVAQRVK